MGYEKKPPADRVSCATDGQVNRPTNTKDDLSADHAADLVRVAAVPDEETKGDGEEQQPKTMKGLRYLTRMTTSQAACR